MRRLIDNDVQRENRKQQRLLLIAERRFGRMFARVLRELSEEMIASFMLTGSAPSLPTDADQRLSSVFVDMSEVVTEAFGARILDQGKAAGHVIETKSFAEFFRRVALEYIWQEAIRQRITSIANTTRETIVAAITRGQEDGLGIAEIAKLISDKVPTVSRGRGALIARTETHGAANNAADAAARATGLTLRKEWVPVQDHRTRDGDDAFNHLAMSGEVVDMDQSFMVPRMFGDPEPMRFPGDPNGSPGNTINCRCNIAHVVVD